MKISTIMVCRNAERTIAGAIESFCMQDHDDRELIVVDGASTDRTCAIVGEFAEGGINLVSEPDNGIYDAMNKGISRITGDAFGFLNADDRYHDASALDHVASALETAEMVTGNLDFVAAHDASPPVRHWHATRHWPGAFQQGWMPPHPTTYARKTVLDRVGPFDAGFRVAGDYDWLLRALELHEATHATIDATLVDMAVGGISTSGPLAKLRNAREMLASRRRHLGSGPIDLAAFLGPLGKLGQLRLGGKPAASAANPLRQTDERVS